MAAWAPTALTADPGAPNLADPDLKLYLESRRKHDLPSWPLQKWDAEDLTGAALYFRADYESARADQEVASARVRSAGQYPNPGLSAGPGYISNAEEGVSPWLLSAALEFPLDWGGRRRYRIEEASHLSRAAQHQVDALAWRIRSQVRSAMVEVLGASETVRLLSLQERNLDEYVVILERRYAAGQFPLPEVTLARINLDRVRLERLDAERRQALARGRLNQAVGIPSAGPTDLALSTDSLSDPFLPAPSDEAVQKLLEARFDLQAAQEEREAALSALRSAQSQRLSSLSAGPGYERDGGENKWRFLFNLGLPLFNQNQGAIAEARARARSEAARQRAAYAVVRAAADQALSGYEFSLKKLQASAELLAAQERHLRAVEGSARVGEAGRFLRLAAEQELLAARLARAEAWTEAQQAWGELENALGAPAP